MPHPHIVPVKVYLAVFAALILLTALTTWVAFLDLHHGPLNTIVALAIAFAKMLLVVLFFMHVKYSGGMVRVVIGAGILWLALLISMAMTDVKTRSWTPDPQPWNAPAASTAHP